MQWISIQISVSLFFFNTSRHGFKISPSSPHHWRQENPAPCNRYLRAVGCLSSALLNIWTLGFYILHVVNEQGICLSLLLSSNDECRLQLSWSDHSISCSHRSFGDSPSPSHKRTWTWPSLLLVLQLADFSSRTFGLHNHVSHFLSVSFSIHIIFGPSWVCSLKNPDQTQNLQQFCSPYFWKRKRKEEIVDSSQE